MTPEAILIELLERVAALQGEMVLVNADELDQWNIDAVETIKAHSLIRKTRPATSVVCGECEEECVRPVQTVHVPSGEPALFLLCEKRSDVNRVPVPISRLEQWQTSGALVAELLSDLLGLRRPDANNTVDNRWEIGMLKGKKHSSHLVLIAGDNLALTLAGHSIPLPDVLAFENNQITIDRRTLTQLVDQPVAGAGDTESAVQRRERLQKRVDELKSNGVKAFLQTTADEESIHVSRLKQILAPNKNKHKSPLNTW